MVECAKNRSNLDRSNSIYYCFSSEKPILILAWGPGGNTKYVLTGGPIRTNSPLPNPTNRAHVWCPLRNKMNKDKTIKLNEGGVWGWEMDLGCEQGMWVCCAWKITIPIFLLPRKDIRSFLGRRLRRLFWSLSPSWHDAHKHARYIHTPTCIGIFVKWREAYRSARA